MMLVMPFVGKVSPIKKHIKHTSMLGKEERKVALICMQRCNPNSSRVEVGKKERKMEQRKEKTLDLLLLLSSFFLTEKMILKNLSGEIGWAKRE